MARVTAIVLTLNEENNIARCLESLRWTDQIIVLDSGSGDLTRDRARELGADVLLHTPDHFDISQQRNWALANAHPIGEWVLFIDADEVVTAELRDILIATIRNAPDSVVAYQLTPMFMFMSRWLKHVQGYPNWHDRLLRAGNVTFAGGVWEHFVCVGEIQRIEAPYYHFSVSKGITDWLEKHNRYSSFEAQDICNRIASITESPGGLTARKAGLRSLAARFWYLRPFARFTKMYFLNRGFLDGFPGLVYCVMIFCYEIMVLLKVVELRHLATGRPL